MHLPNTKCYTGFQETVATLSLSQASAEDRAPARDAMSTWKDGTGDTGVFLGWVLGSPEAPERLSGSCWVGLGAQQKQTGL